MSTPVRLNALVIGSGWSRHAAHAFASREEVRVRGVVARGSKRSFDLAGALDVPLFDKLADAILEARPKLAVVAVGDRDNPILALELLKAGAHILCGHPVAPTAEEVLAIARVARERDLIASTDYSLRTTQAFRLGQSAIAELGRLLRIEITYPGRFLPIALDLALALGGHVDSVSAFARYPEELRARRQAAPAAFPPTIILEHVRGVVTALTPSPHAAPAASIRITTSSTGGRMEIGLPAGGARQLRCRPGGLSEETELAPAYTVTDAGAAFGAAMRVLTNTFVDAILKGGEPPCAFEGEAHIRRIWAAIPRAVSARAAIMVDEAGS